MTKEEAINTLANFKRYISGGGVIDVKANEAIDMAIEALQTPTGKWQKVDEQPYFRKHFDNVCCSICHHKGMRKYNFCPNCGANMKSEVM